MGKATTVKIAHDKAIAKFNRTKAKAEAEPSAKNEAVYQKAKRELAVTRREWKRWQPRAQDGDGTATPEPLKVSGKKPTKG